MSTSEIKLKISVDSNTGKLKILNEELEKFGKTVDGSSSKTKGAVEAYGRCDDWRK